MAISKEERKVLLKAQQGELDAVKMYNALAKTVTDEKLPRFFVSSPLKKAGTPLSSKQ